jgi:protein-tyrosine phosphatase
MLSYPINGPWPGKLAIIPRPRGGDWLPDEVKSLRREGFDIVVSLLTPEEVQELGLACEAKLIREQGLQYCNYPINDLGVPSSRKTALNFLDMLYRSLLAGKKIALHCRGSIGRSGLIASSILVLAGIEPARAISEVSDARKLESPETAEQRKWVMTITAETASSRT